MAMRRMKASMKKASMKAMKKSSMRRMKRAMKVSKIAKGKRAKSSVFRGTKVKTVGGLKKENLKRNKNGKVVSKKQSDQAKKRYNKTIGRWTAAVVKARKALNVRGFQTIGGKTRQGQELLKKARSFYKK